MVAVSEAVAKPEMKGEVVRGLWFVSGSKALLSPNRQSQPADEVTRR